MPQPRVARRQGRHAACTRRAVSGVARDHAGLPATHEDPGAWPWQHGSTSAVRVHACVGAPTAARGLSPRCRSAMRAAAMAGAQKGAGEGYGQGAGGSLTGHGTFRYGVPVRDLNLLIANATGDRLPGFVGLSKVNRKPFLVIDLVVARGKAFCGARRALETSAGALRVCTTARHSTACRTGIRAAAPPPLPPGGGPCAVCERAPLAKETRCPLAGANVQWVTTVRSSRGRPDLFVNFS